MRQRSQPQPKLRNVQNRNRRLALGSSRRALVQGKRARGLHRDACNSFMPPEDWYEPAEEAGKGYRIIVQSPGENYRHVVTPAEIRQRLAELPAWMTAPLENVQLSRMTRKKASFPCYGMQWGTTLYLYPLEYDPQEGFVEWLGAPPTPAQQIEAKMYGTRWEEVEPGTWKLRWSETAIRNFFLNNILIHELGHLLDDRNASYDDRERYAEWFALHYGYKCKGKQIAARPQRVKRRHHSS